MKSWWKRFEPLLALPFLVVAVLAIHHEMREFRWSEVRTAVAALPAGHVVLAVLLTIGSFLILSTYDALGLRYAGHPLRYARTALASFIGYAFSNALGFPLLTGAPVRYRLYTAWEVEAARIRDLVAFYTASFWIGFLALGGVALFLSPVHLPRLLGLPTRPLGIVFALLAAAYVLWGVWGRGGMQVGGWRISPPGPALTLAQLVVSMADWAAAAAVLFVILPPHTGLSYPGFLGIFLLAQVAGLVSHVPGGLGVFEAVILTLLPDDIGHGALLGSLLVYRAVYYLLPLLAAVAALGAFEAGRRRREIGRAAGVVGRGLAVVVPQAMAIATFVAGLVLLFSGSTPAMGGRLRWLNDVFPLGLIEASHFLASVAGGGLLVLAWGIQRRLDAAYHLAVTLMVTGIVFTLLKGLDYEEAIFLAITTAALVASRGEFYRRASLMAEPFTATWAAAVVGALIATVGLGLLAYKNVVYTDALWWRFARDADAPRFLRATVGTLTAVGTFALARLLTPARPAALLPLPDDVDTATRIARASPRAYAQLALLGDKHFLFDDHRTAFVMYGVEGRSWVAMGDPVGPAPAARELAWQFLEQAHRHGDYPVFYQVEPGHLPLYIDLGLALTKIGEEARVPLASFSLEGGRRKGMRYTVRKMEERGGAFRVLPPDEVPSVLPRLRAISDDWLEGKATREKGFSLGFFQPEYLQATNVAVVEVDSEIVAFANVLQGADRHELSVDLMRYAAGAPPSTMEFLFVQLLLWGQKTGFEWFSLGMAPLAGLEDRHLAPLWARLGAALFHHGEQFYNFEGLREYKEKFGPVWEPRYIASPGGLALPRVLTNVATLVSGGMRGMVGR